MANKAYKRWLKKQLKKEGAKAKARVAVAKMAEAVAEMTEEEQDTFFLNLMNELGVTEDTKLADIKSKTETESEGITDGE